MANRYDSWCVRTLIAYLCILLAVDRVCSSERTNPAAVPQPLTDDRGGRIAKGQNLHSLPFIENGTYFIPDIDSYSNTQLYALLVDILEKLNVLVPKTPSCYRLQKIEREVRSQGGGDPGQSASDSQSLIGVYLYFQESPVTPSSNRSTSVEAASSGSVNVTESVKKAASGGGDPQLSLTVKASNECVSEPQFVQTMDAQPLVRDANDTHERRGAAAGQAEGGEDKDNGTVGAGTPQMNGNTGKNEGNGFEGLSRTQVVVISTCSAIISIFFIVAFVLRVRNYMKRVREEQQQARRPTFRSCSVRLRSVSHSNEQVRRDSLVSKISHQSNMTGRGGGGGGGGGGRGSYSMTNGSCNSREHSNASTPRHDPDTKPLLLVTAAVTEGAVPSSNRSPPPSLPPTPSESQSSSLQFIDEETRGRKADRAASRTLSADDSEARPLLASSEVSANSLHLSPTSPTSLPTTSLSLTSQDSANGAVAAMADSPALVSEAPPNPLLASGPASGEPAPASGGPNDAGNVPGRTEEIPSGSAPGASDRKASSSSMPREEENRAGGAGVGEAANAGAEDARADAAESDRATPVPLIGFCGLTRSDSSLSSTDGNQNYCYGTQKEYVPPDLGYYTAAECINGMNTPYHALRFLPRVYGARSFVPSDYYASRGSSSIPGVGRMRSVDLTKQDSLMSDYGWYDYYGNIYSPPPLSASADSAFGDFPSAITSEARSDLQSTSSFSSHAAPPTPTVLSDPPHTAEACPGVGATSAADSDEPPRLRAQHEHVVDMCEGEPQDKSGPGCIAAVSGGTDLAVGERNHEVTAAVGDALKTSPESRTQTRAGPTEPSLSLVAGTHPPNHGQSDGQSKSHDHIASTRADVADSEQLEKTDGEGVGQLCPSPTSPTSNTPDGAKVVMKRLLSTDERTTFL